ncbi:flavin reductase family protein [Bordetella petrii]|uniref:flavin reductase family protein n=1 Tax=Bordetella petrii TaxID=94624 RepID=UPI001A962C00|nr:flavin reductase family protein [Bordetella petrii]MBO1113298.1 flavin reductase family protein [Bordetella petrii]
MDDTQDDIHFYRPEAGHGLAHDPFKAIVAPRIIGWISSLNAAGQPNLAPYSFCSAVSSRPDIISFSSAGYKDSVRNIEATREFAWNFVSRELVETMNATSEAVDAEVSEFQLAGIEPAAGRAIKAPHVAASPAVLECKLVDILALKDMNGDSAGHWVVFGQVVGVHIRRKYLRDGLFDTFLANPALRAGYRADYMSEGKRFELFRPGQG